MKHQDLIDTCVFEQIQGLLFSDLSGPLSVKFSIANLVFNNLHLIFSNFCKQR